MTSTRSQSAGKLVPWLAGMIDADGSIGLHKQAYKTKSHLIPSISLVTSCRITKEFLDGLFSELYVGKYVTERTPKNTNWNKVWVFEVRGMKRVQSLLETLRPHLVTKAREADIVTAFIDYRQSQSKMIPYGAFEAKCKSDLSEIKKNRN